MGSGFGPAMGIPSALFCLLLPVGASASDIPFAVIGAQEYNLPGDFKPFNVFATYGEYNRGNQTYDTEGNAKDSDEHLFVNLNKYARFFKIPGVSEVNFVVEYVQPIVHLQTPRLRRTGIADPQVGALAYIKPTANSTLGYQTIVSFPVGSRQFGNRYWMNLSSVFFDLQQKRFAISGNAGILIRGRRIEGDEPRINDGNTLHFNLRPSLKLGGRVEPFLALDWQRTAASRVGSTQQTIPSGHDLSVGAGALWVLNKRTAVNAHYSRSVDGRNVVRTNALYMAFATVF